MRIETTPNMTLEDIEKWAGQELVVRNRRNVHPDMLYYCSIRGLEIKERRILASAHGDGDSPDDAAEAFCDNISYKTLVVGAYTDSRRELETGKVTYNKGE